MAEHRSKPKPSRMYQHMPQWCRSACQKWMPKNMLERVSMSGPTIAWELIPEQFPTFLNMLYKMCQNTYQIIPDLIPEQVSEHLSMHSSGISVNTCALPSSKSSIRVGISRTKVRFLCAKVVLLNLMLSLVSNTWENWGKWPDHVCLNYKLFAWTAAESCRAPVGNLDIDNFSEFPKLFVFLILRLAFGHEQLLNVLT